MLKICFVSAGSGGSEINNVLIKELLKNKSYKIINLAITPYAKEKLNNYIYITKSNILDYLKNVSPDVIINERSNDLKIQNKVTKFAKENNIFNIAVLDYYGNYKNRFTSIPNYMLVPSNKIKLELLEEINISNKNVFVSGNPSFDRVYNLKYNRSEKNKILFASQPLDKNGVAIQYKVFNEFVNEIIKYNKPTIYIKPHPRENNKKWLEVINNNTYKNIKLIEFDNNNDFLITCTNYDLIIGYYSTILLQCYYANIPQISYLQDWKKALNSYFNNTFVNTTYYNGFLNDATDKTLNVIVNIINEHFNALNIAYGG